MSRIPIRAVVAALVTFAFLAPAASSAVVPGFITLRAAPKVAEAKAVVALPRYWSLDTPLPHRQGSVVAVRARNGTIYAVGLSKFGGGRFFAFDPSTHTWTVKAPFPKTGPQGNVTAAADGKIYVLGEAYHPATNRWTKIAPMPHARSGGAAVTGKDGKIYVVGGGKPDPGDSSNTLYPRRVEVYDPKTNTWQVKAPMPTGREGLGAAVGADGTIYAIGGGTDHFDRYFKCYSAVEAYNPATNKWSKRRRLPNQMCNVAAGSTRNGKIVAVAGSTIAGGEMGSHITHATGSIVAFNPATNHWTTISRTPFRRKGAGAVVAPHGNVYVIGGLDRFDHGTKTVQKCAHCGSR